MIARTELRKIARARLRDAEALLGAERYDAAVYLAGYAVEIALKARICRTLRWDVFPSTVTDFKGYHSFRTHDLDTLLSLSGAEQRIERAHQMAWDALGAWKPEMRYEPDGAVTFETATSVIASARALLKVL
jgi:HEPN domain-containing protein